jgi:hypothetical protein
MLGEQVSTSDRKTEESSRAEGEDGFQRPQVLELGIEGEEMKAVW